MSTTSKGKAAERKARVELEAEGYAVTQAHLSRGAADLIAFRQDGMRFIQVKHVGPNTDISKAEVRRNFDALPLPPGATCELWIWRPRKGWTKEQVRP